MLNASIKSLSTLHSSLIIHHSSFITVFFDSQPNAAGVGIELFSQGESLDGPMMFA